MRVLLDTCVLSELRHPHGKTEVKRRVRELMDEDLYISVITIGEIVKGVSMLDNSKRKKELQIWLGDLERFYTDRVLPVDVETSHIWGELTAEARRQGRGLGACDGLIAATARRHGLHVMTRNISDFEPTGAMLINPWEA